MVNRARVIQAYGTYGKNPIGLAVDVAKNIGERLDQLCATENTLYHQLKKHHWMVVGAEYLPVHKFLDELADHARDAGDKLAERVTALGGVPTGGPKAQQELSLFAYEETEDAVDVRTMLGRDLSAETTLVVELRKCVEVARVGGDFGTMDLLMDLLLEHEEEAHHLDHWLEPDTLVQGAAPK